MPHIEGGGLQSYKPYQRAAFLADSFTIMSRIYWNVTLNLVISFLFMTTNVVWLA
jgi:hypothetical protein